MDPAILFLLNPDWKQCTLDTLRGGVYIHLGIPWVVCLPITAWHSKAKAKDIAKLNEGFLEKGDFEEFKAERESEEDDDEDDEVDEEDDRAKMEWHDPIVIPYGRIVLRFDLQKMARLLGRLRKKERFKNETTRETHLLGPTSSEGS